MKRSPKSLFQMLKKNQLWGSTHTLQEWHASFLKPLSSRRPNGIPGGKPLTLANPSWDVPLQTEKTNPTCSPPSGMMILKVGVSQKRGCPQITQNQTALVLKPMTLSLCAFWRITIIHQMYPHHWYLTVPILDTLH